MWERTSIRAAPNPRFPQSSSSSYAHAHFLTVNAQPEEIFICLSNNDELVPTFALSPSWHFHSFLLQRKFVPKLGTCSLSRDQFPRIFEWCDKRGERGFLTMGSRARKLALKRCDTAQPEMEPGFKKFSKRTFEIGKGDADAISDAEPSRKLEHPLLYQRCCQ